MAGVRDLDHAARHIDQGETRRDEHAVAVTGRRGSTFLAAAARLAHQPVQSGKQLPRRLALPHQGQQAGLEHRHPETGREAVPRHVRDDHAKPAPVPFPLAGKLEDVEVIAADRGRRLEEGGELDPLHLQSLARDQVLLDFAGELEFPLQGTPRRALGDQALEARRHLVERGLKRADLVPAPHRDPGPEVSRLHGLGGGAQPVHGPAEADDHERGHDRRADEDVEEQEGGNEEEQPAQRVHLARGREEMAEDDRLGRRQRHRDLRRDGRPVGKGVERARHLDADDAERGARVQGFEELLALRAALGPRQGLEDELRTPEDLDRPTRAVRLARSAKADPDVAAPAQFPLQRSSGGRVEERQDRGRLAAKGGRQRRRAVGQNDERRHAAPAAQTLRVALRFQPRRKRRGGPRIAGHANVVLVVGQGRASLRHWQVVRVEQPDLERLDEERRDGFQLLVEADGRVPVQVAEEEAGQQVRSDDHEHQAEQEGQQTQQDVAEGQPASHPPQQAPLKPDHGRPREDESGHAGHGAGQQVQNQRRLEREGGARKPQGEKQPRQPGGSPPTPSRAGLFVATGHLGSRQCAGLPSWYYLRRHRPADECRTARSARR